MFNYSRSHKVLNKGNKMKPQNFEVSVVLCREGEGWAAQCLQYDIAAQGKTIQEAKDSLEKAFVSQVMIDLLHETDALSAIPQAPREYWVMFERGERLTDRKPFYFPPEMMVRASTQELRICA
jgi:hypothetical protein